MQLYSSYILELYKVINFDANYFKQVKIVPLDKSLTYQYGFIVAYCSNMVFKDGYKCTNHNIISALNWNWKNVV